VNAENTLVMLMVQKSLKVKIFLLFDLVFKFYLDFSTYF